MAGLSVQAMSPERLLHGRCTRTEAPTSEPPGRAALAGRWSPGLANTCSPHRCRALGDLRPTCLLGMQMEDRTSQGPIWVR